MKNGGSFHSFLYVYQNILVHSWWMWGPNWITSASITCSLHRSPGTTWAWCPLELNWGHLTKESLRLKVSMGYPQNIHFLRGISPWIHFGVHLPEILGKSHMVWGTMIIVSVELNKTWKSSDNLYLKWIQTIDLHPILRDEHRPA